MDTRNQASRIMKENHEGNVLNNCKINMADIKDQLICINMNKLKNLSKDLKVRSFGKTKKDFVDKILASIKSREDQEMVKTCIRKDSAP